MIIKFFIEFLLNYKFNKFISYKFFSLKILYQKMEIKNTSSLERICKKISIEQLKFPKLRHKSTHNHYLLIINPEKIHALFCPA